MSKPKLALIPSGYKSGKVYSILPNDATGDFDFTRQSIGTRVRKDGLIEEAKTVGSITNELLYSEDFTQGFWLKTNTTITADDTLAPDGTNTADKIIPNTSNSVHRIQTNVQYNSSVYTFSVYAKKDFYKNILIWFDGHSGGLGVNLDDSSIFRNENIQEHNIDVLANGWYRISITANITINSRPSIYVYDNSATPQITFAGNGVNGLFIWGAMLSEGALSDYIKTEGSQETKRVETFTDVPRLDWLNSNCPSLLLEPQRTQLATYNTNITSANGYALTNGSLEENTTIAPDGTLTASTFKATADSGRFQKVKTGGTIGSEYTVSAYVKRKKGTGQVYIRAVENANILVTATDEWTRVSATVEATSTNIRYGMALQNADDEIYVWGFQVEEATYESSFIYNTASGTVTRLKDDLQDLNNVDLINSVEGVFYAEIRAFKSETVFRFITLNDGTSSNTVRIYLYNRIYARLLVGGVEQCIFNTTNYDVTEFNKIAFLYSPNNFKLFVNGVLIGTDTSGSTFTNGTLTTLSFDRGDNAFRFDGAVKDLRVYDTTLTDAELTELTTL